jgi:hypothetical protein
MKRSSNLPFFPEMATARGSGAGGGLKFLPTMAMEMQRARPGGGWPRAQSGCNRVGTDAAALPPPLLQRHRPQL